jgi:hypothetical protein
MEDCVKFSIGTEELNNLIKRLNLVEHVNSRKKHSLTTEVTVKTGYVEFNSPGYYQKITADTTGICRFSVRISFLIKLLKSYKKSILYFEIYRNRLQIENLSILVSASFFHDDRILRSIQLPINFNYIDLLRLKPDQYTKEEIDLSNLEMQIKYAREMFTLDLMAAYKLLEIYRIEYNTFRNWVCLELGLNPLDFISYELEHQKTILHND